MNSDQARRLIKVTFTQALTFPRGMSCVWDIRKPVRKHYRFG